MIKDDLFAAARAGAGMSQSKAASVCGLSLEAYRSREKRPGEFRLKELSCLAENLGDNSRKILLDAVFSIFLQE